MTWIAGILGGIGLVCVGTAALLTAMHVSAHQREIDDLKRELEEVKRKLEG